MQTVLLADDHPLIVEGLRKLLEKDFVVIGAVQNGRSLVEVAQRCRPDLVITDLTMPGIDGIEATRQLRLVAPEIRVLVLSVHTEPSSVQAAFQAGAWGYLTKSSAPDEIEIAVREVLAGRFYVSPAVARAAIFPLAQAHGEGREPADRPSPYADALTPRECDIVHLLAKGLCNKDIAHRLGVSVTTVRTHLHSVYDKLGMASRVELALLAAQPAGADA
ncbi:MAG TPA: response regulator transcription factor [Thermoanaerobaculia bacterium]|nr:response regulator transcription factor [Thermoanaerobaculia bacterium]